tara:strand:+ start:687 stop:2222 length:1536 start_codon:yes stop_codon:yes gene_type:complete
MDFYRLGQFLRTFGQSIASGVEEEITSTVRLVSETLKISGKAALELIKFLGSADPASGEFSQSIRPIIEEEIETGGSPNPGLNAFIAGISGEERPQEESEQVIGGGDPFGPNIGSPIKVEPEALSVESIDEIQGSIANFAGDSATQLPPAVLAAQDVDPIAIGEEGIISDLIQVMGGEGIRFIGLDTSGYPLGYTNRQEPGGKYGNFPVYLPGMSSSLYRDFAVSESYIIDLQDKLIDAGYLRTSFETGVFDESTEAAVIEMMGVHNKEGRVPPIPEVAGSLLDFLGLGEEGNTAYAWDSAKQKVVRDFIDQELLVDIQNRDNRLDKDVVTQIPEFQDETAAFIMLNALQQAAGGIALNRSNIKNPTTLINNLMRDAVIDTKQLVRDAEDMGIAANQAQIDRARNIQNLKARNPELSEAELKVLYPDLFKEVEVPISGELGVNPSEETILARQNQIFNARLTEATNRLLEPTVDFVNKRNAINQNTRNFLRASRGLNVLSGDAPTATNPNI